MPFVPTRKPGVVEENTATQTAEFPPRETGLVKSSVNNSNIFQTLTPSLPRFLTYTIYKSFLDVYLTVWMEKLLSHSSNEYNIDHYLL